MGFWVIKSMMQRAFIVFISYLFVKSYPIIVYVCDETQFV